MKPLLIVLGVLSAVGVLGQLVMGQLILLGRPLQKAHQHSGYATVAVATVYIALSLIWIISQPRRSA